MATKVPSESTSPQSSKNKKSKGTLEFTGTKDWDRIAASVFSGILNPSTSEPKTAERKPDLDTEVAKIFQQALQHRDKLIKFFVRYTWVFSLFVALIIVGQALARAFIPGKENVELIPYWALNLLVVGLIGQFITLLTIVTKKVWLFEAFFKHADTHHSLGSSSVSSDDKDNN